MNATLDDRASIYSKKSMKTYQSSNLGALQNYRRRNNETASAAPSNATTPYQNSVVNDRKTISAHKDDYTVFNEPNFKVTKMQREE